MSGTEVVVALLIALGLVGVLLPLLPGSLLVGAAILFWAFSIGTPTGWLFFAVAAVVLGAGSVVKYAVPGRRLHSAGVPRTTLLIGGVLGVVGFFVVPVVGLVIGFVLGVFLAELGRLGERSAAWHATVAAIKAVGVSMLIEFGSALLAAVVWAVGVVAT